MRFQVISVFAHRAGEIASRVATAEFASHTMAESHVRKVERSNPGAKCSIVDREGSAFRPFASLLAGMTV